MNAVEDDEHESDMEFSGEGSDMDHEDDMPVDVEDDDEDDEDEPEPEEDMDSDDDLSPPPLPHKPRLKIKLKLPQILSPNESSSRAASTPSGGPSRPPSHRGVSRDVDVESEDEDEVVGGSTRPMTSRQAVLASVVDSSHVSLSESSRKKKQLTESELALRREETARKRKNLTEKKLEDEKAETINRLLKKQSKSKTKRNVLSTADDRTPVSATPAVVQSTRDGSEAPDGEVLEPLELVPTMYRWSSSTRSLSGEMTLAFSVPVSVLAPVPSEMPSPVTETPVCDVSGCARARKYRLVTDWVKGACGITHLKMLERQMDIV